MNVDSALLISWSVRLCAIGVAVESFEVLAHWRHLCAGALLSWLPGDRPVGPISTLLRPVLGYPASALVLAARGMAALALLALPLGGGATFALLAWLVATQLYYNRRFTMLAGNSDTMFLIVLTGLLVASLPGGSLRLRSSAFAFIAVQLLLAYTVAGANKLVSPVWRNGMQLRQVLRFSSYCVPPFASTLADQRPARLALAWGVIGLQLLFPLSLLLPNWGFWAFVVAGLAFHGGIAFLMGLHGFWWSFVAAYPALYFVHAYVQSALYS